MSIEHPVILDRFDSLQELSNCVIFLKYLGFNVEGRAIEGRGVPSALSGERYQIENETVYVAICESNDYDGVNLVYLRCNSPDPEELPLWELIPIKSRRNDYHKALDGKLVWRSEKMETLESSLRIVNDEEEV